MVCERLRPYIARLVYRRLTNFETTDRHGIMPSLRLLRAVEERRGDLKRHGVCHDTIPTLGLQYSTITAPRLTAAPHQISNSLLVSFLTNKFVEVHMTRTRQTYLCSSPSTHWLTTLVLFASRPGRRQMLIHLNHTYLYKHIFLPRQSSQSIVTLLGVV